MREEEMVDHLNGKHVVVEYTFGNTVTRFLLEDLDEDSDALALWQDVAFTNGPPLAEIRMRWDQQQADAIRAERDTAAPVGGAS